jgi:hypothetical protein
MRLIVKDPDKNLPPGYKRFETYGFLKDGFPFQLPFPGGIASVHRFAARYRFAKEFQSASFETYSQSTARAYAALCKYQFTYGAFEALQRMLGAHKDLGKLEGLLKSYPIGKWDAAIRSASTYPRVFNFLRSHLGDGLKAECEKFLRRRPYNILLIAQAMRNSFVHGHLTPSAYGADPEDTRRICIALGDALLMFMDREFSSRVVLAIQDVEAELDVDEWSELFN